MHQNSDMFWSFLDHFQGVSYINWVYININEVLNGLRILSVECIDVMKLAVDVYAELVHEMRKSYYGFYNCSGCYRKNNNSSKYNYRIWLIIMYT